MEKPLKNKQKQFRALRSTDLSNKKDEVKQIEGIFPKNMLNDLIVNKSKEIVTLQDITNTHDLHYKSKRRKYKYIYIYIYIYINICIYIYIYIYCFHWAQVMF